MSFTEVLQVEQPLLRTLPKVQALCVALIGPGGVGGTLLDQLGGALPRLANRLRLVPEVRALCNSERMLLAGDMGRRCLALKDWRSELSSDAYEATDLTRLTQYLEQQNVPVAVVDTTASPQVAQMHAAWLRRGFSVLTANKVAGAGPLAAYEDLRLAERRGGARYLCETTVGAGLPVIGVLADFVATGDNVLQIDGILSGTLSHLFHRVEAGTPFSAALRTLHTEGFTEPDPRLDLSGEDVARKLVILSRIAGLAVSLEGVGITSAIDLSASRGESAKQFLAGCDRYDEAVADLCFQARSRGKVLRYGASITRAGKAEVGLIEVDLAHPFARLRPGDNLIQITTERYRENPLVIQGPGAGRAVTAAGLLADLLRLAI